MEQVCFYDQNWTWEGLGTRRAHDVMLTSNKYYEGLMQYFTDLHKTHCGTEYNSNKPAERCKTTIDLLQYEYDYIVVSVLPLM